MVYFLCGPCLGIGIALAVLLGLSFKEFDETPSWYVHFTFFGTLCFFLASFIIFLEYEGQDPAHFSSEQKLSYYEAGKEIPTERDPQIEEAFKQGQKYAIPSSMIIVTIGYIVWYKLIFTRERKKRDKLRKLNQERNKLRNLYGKCGRDNEEIISKSIEVIDKTIRNIEWQDILYNMKDSLKVVNDIKNDSFWKDLQKSIDELEAFMELTADELED